MRVVLSMMDTLRKYWFVKAVLALWLASVVPVLLLLSRIDSIVHGDLYNFGLQFSVAWADPYWTALHLIYVSLAVPAVFSVVVLIVGLKGTGEGATRATTQAGAKLSTQARVVRENSMLIRCIKCGKVFGKPLTMLDFSNGKPRLANVCPYCNHVLGSADDKGTSTRITSVEVEEDVDAQ